MNLLAIDVGGTEIKSAIVDADYNLSNWDSKPTPQDSLDSFIDSIEEIYLRYKDKVEGVAVAIPGFVDVENGVCNSGGALLYNAGQPIGKLLQERLGCKVHLENDGKAAALAELANGSLKGCKNAAVFIIGTGIGGGIIIDGKLLRGRNFTAGELSFLNVNIEKDNDPNYMFGTICNYCTTPALIKMYQTKSGDDSVTNGKQFFEKYHQGNSDAIEVLEVFTKNIAIQLMNLGIILNCEKIAVGGGISKQEVLVEKINEKMNKSGLYSFFYGANDIVDYLRPEVVNCVYLSNANLIGAVYSYLQQEEKEN